MPVSRKLPPHDELYDLVVKQKKSYGEIAVQYGTDKGAVCARLKYGILKRGGEWPIKREPAAVRIAHGLRNAMIDSTFLREDLREAYTLAKKQFVGTDVLIGANTQHRSQRRYHLPGCGRMPCDPVTRDKATVESQGYVACGLCCILSVRQWVEDIGSPVSPGEMARLLSHAHHPEVAQVRKVTALKLLSAIGGMEEMHASLADYSPISSRLARR